MDENNLQDQGLNNGKVNGSIIKGFERQLSKTAQQAQHDSRDIADPSEEIKLGTKKDFERKLDDKNEEVSGVSDKSQELSTEKELSGKPNQKASQALMMRKFLLKKMLIQI